ncbi:hypothetical protein GF376_01810 [Candidatus Peregrinibacteria bacterium]|nr:hypothetical protein [Candidatus Peregrinibacteria bacterium]
MYKHLEIIVEKFLAFSAKNEVSDEVLKAILSEKGLSFNQVDLPKLKYMVKIMTFLRPGKIYEYLEGASFGKLLKNIKKEKMIGDCNQITTFYVFLYSLKYPIKELQIKLPKDHVCLQFKGIDIEATNGTFQKYTEYEYILPITELISTNLLDVSDFRDKQIKVDPNEFLKGAQLAFNISSKREIVQKNLKSAYNNVAVDALNANNFKTAEFFFNKINDQEALKSVYHNAVIYFVKQNNFSKARYYQSKTHDQELKKYVDEREAFYYFDKNKNSKALDLFKKMGNDRMVKACYGREYNKIQKKVKGLNTISQMKSHKSDYRKMVDLAKKMGDYNLAGEVEKILKQL